MNSHSDIPEVLLGPIEPGKQTLGTTAAGLLIGGIITVSLFQAITKRDTELISAFNQQDQISKLQIERNIRIPGGIDVSEKIIFEK